jgi:hypothetical protein
VWFVGFFQAFGFVLGLGLGLRCAGTERASGDCRNEQATGRPAGFESSTYVHFEAKSCGEGMGQQVAQPGAATLPGPTYYFHTEPSQK